MDATRPSKLSFSTLTFACGGIDYDPYLLPTNVTRLFPFIVGARRLPSAVAPRLCSYTPALARAASGKPRVGVATSNTNTVTGDQLCKTAGRQHPMNNQAWTVRALSVPGDDTDLSIWVSFDNARFCFGAGEATQRAFIQKRLKMAGMQAVFLPDGDSGRGGLPGVIMTLADMGCKEVAVVGPPDTNTYLASLRASVMRDQFAVNTYPFPRDSTAPSELVYSHPRMDVHAVRLGPAEERGLTTPATSTPLPRPAALSQKDADAYAAAAVQELFGRNSDLPRPPISRPPLFQGTSRYNACDDRYPLPLPSDADAATDMVYIARTPDVRGKFDAALAKRLNIPHGPIRAELAKGLAIEYDDPTAPGGRRRVTPEEALVGGGPGAILIVVHCRDHNLERLLESNAFADYASGNLKARAIVHRVSDTVWEDARYQSWMAAFGPDTQHMFASTTSTHETFFASAAWHALKLNMIDGDIFTVPHYVAEARLEPTLAPNASILQSSHIIGMHPPKPLEVVPPHEKDVAFPTTEAELEEACKTLLATPNLADFVVAAKAAKKSVDEAAAARPAQAPAPGDDIVITTLGTGSAVPSKYRNVSATHLAVPGMGGILLDCGEGTLGQMRRHFGPEGMKKMYDELRLINISHMHADHHLGLCNILADRFRHSISTPLYIIAPTWIALQLQETAFWQTRATRQALENVRWINAARLKFPWSLPERRGTPPHIPTLTVEEALEDANSFCELSAAEDVAAGVRKWPFTNVFRSSIGANVRFHDAVFDMLEDLGLAAVHTPLVSHRGVAYGLVLTHKSGWKVAYSGDTMPCDGFIQAAQDATIVIHEATLEDDKPDVAAKKGHSTFGQAIDVGKRMNAKYIILNHFSQRYPKAPNLELDAAGPSVSISFDFMSLRAADTWKMAHYMDAINTLFRDEEEDDDIEAAPAPAPAAKTKGDKQKPTKGDAADKSKPTAAAADPAEKAKTKQARRAGRAERRKQSLDDVKAAAASTGTAGVKRESSASDDDIVAKKARGDTSAATAPATTTEAVVEETST